MRIIILFFFLTWISLNAQDYTPQNDDAQLRAEYLNSTQEVYKKAKTNYPKSFKSEFQQLYRLRYESLKSRVEFEYFIFSKPWDSYLKNLKNSIARANPSFDFTAIRILISRDEDFNAYSVGEGTIIVNIGLLNKIEEESELAFVLCHEFSHFLLNHSDSAMYKKLSSRNSAAYKAKIKELENTKNDQMTKLKKFIRDDVYMERKISRRAENQADSLGLILLLNTSFAPSGALMIINQLKKINKEPMYVQLNIFNYLGRNTLVEKEPSFVKRPAKNLEDEDDDENDEKEKVMLDSSLLLSHPNLLERAMKINTLLEMRQIDATTKTTNSDSYLSLKAQCKYNYCEALLQMGHYDMALLYALQQQIANPESTYFKEAAFYSYFKIYEAKKSHHAGLMFENPSSVPDSARTWIKNYINLTRLTDLRKDAGDYYKKYDNQIEETERNIFARAMLAADLLEMKAYYELKEKYIHSYPQGKFKPQFIK